MVVACSISFSFLFCPARPASVSTFYEAKVTNGNVRITPLLRPGLSRMGYWFVSLGKEISPFQIYTPSA
jgi:hypothetical protein